MGKLNNRRSFRSAQKYFNQAFKLAEKRNNFIVLMEAKKRLGLAKRRLEKKVEEEHAEEEERPLKRLKETKSPEDK